MSSHGGYGPARTLVGSVTDEVVRGADDPVVVVGPRVPDDFMLGDRRIVACLDGSSCAERTVAPAQRWSQVLGLPLWLVQVAPSRAPAVDAARPGVRPARSAEALARSLRGVDGWQVVRGRDPARSLATVAETWPVAAFVMATHGRAGWTRVLKGSVTAATVRRARVPVLVVPAAVEAR